MTPAEFKSVRLAMGYNTTQLAEALGLRQHGKRTIERIESGSVVTGPMALAMAKLLDDARSR